MPRRAGRKKTFDNKVKDIVKKELSNELEEKHAITEYADVMIHRDIPSGIVLNGSGNFFALLPEIKQYTTVGATGLEYNKAYNSRIGNEVCLKSIDITGHLSYALANTTAVDYANGKLAVRVMILRSKEINDIQTLFANMPTNNLIRFGNQTLGGAGAGSGAFGGYSLDAFRDINRETFSVRYDKVIYLDAPVLLPGTTGGDDVSVVPSAARLFKHKLTFGKNGLKLKYTSNADNNPNNFPYFMVVGYSSMSSSARPADNLVRCSISCVGQYTDA